MRNKARFLLSRSKARQQYDIAKSHADMVSYSFKTNFEIGRVLEDETNSFFSIHSIESAEMLKDMNRVFFLAQAWNEQEMDMVFEKGINKVIVDNEMDLKSLLDYMENKDMQITLLLRIRLKEHTIHTGKYYVYGMKKDLVKKWLPELKEHDKIKELGLHFHRKTQNISEWSLKYELSNMFTNEDLKGLDYLNIGGGLPAEYKNFRKEVMTMIFGKIDELKEWINDKGIKLILEPGRFLAASPIVLEAKVMNIYDNNVIVNCSVWNSAMDTFVAHIRLLVEGEKDDGIPYTIKGNSPDSMDIIRYRVFMPKLKVGDTIRFLNAGAYNFHTNFCNLPKIETVVCD